MRKLKNLTKRALAVLLSILTFFTTIGIAPERETEAAALAPKLVSPIALYNKSAEYGGYCYTSGGPDHYILLPTAEPALGRGCGGMCPPPKFRKGLGIIRHSLYLKLRFCVPDTNFGPFRYENFR